MESIVKLKNIYKALYDFEKQYLDINEVTINEAIILNTLIDNKPKIAKDLYSSVGLSKSRVSRILSDMEKKGYISRKISKEDKRNIFFQLTHAGISKAKEITTQRINFSNLVTQITDLTANHH